MTMVGYCPVCEDEFRPEITVCSDCGAALVLQEEGLGAGGTATNGPAPGWRDSLDSAPVATLVPLRTFDSLRDLEPVLAAFAEAELPSRVLVQNGRYILLVHPDTLSGAQEALTQAEGDVPEPADSTFDPSTGRYRNCPACDTRLAEGPGTNCPECGLELSAPRLSATVPEGE